MTIARQLLVLACLQAKPSVGRHRIGQKILNFEGDAAARPELLERARDANSEAPDTGPKYDPGYRARRQTLGLKCFGEVSSEGAQLVSGVGRLRESSRLLPSRSRES